MKHLPDIAAMPISFSDYFHDPGLIDPYLQIWQRYRARGWKHAPPAHPSTGHRYTRQRRSRDHEAGERRHISQQHTNRPTSIAIATECQDTKRKIVPSCPYQLVAVAATTMDWASIIQIDN